MIGIADPSCPGLGLVVLARSMRRTSAALSVWGPFPAGTAAGARRYSLADPDSAALLHAQNALLSALSSPGLLQTRLPPAPVTITEAIYQGGCLPPRRLTQRASLEETAWYF